MSAALLALFGCPSAPTPMETASPTPTPAPSNVLVLFADDVGIDNIGAYERHPDHAPTPHIDALAAEGVRFTRTWATPSCSPARAQLLTGRYGRRYGMGIRIDMLPWAETFALRQEEVTLGELAWSAGYATSFVGKWHLTHYAEGWLMAPYEQGFDWFAISGGNLNVPSVWAGAGFHRWERNENGEVDFTGVYATTSQADDAVAQLGVLEEPWLMVVSFNAAHDPFHVPPPELHTDSELDESSSIPRKYRAAVEAMDTEIGRILGAIPDGVRERTYIVFASDNGTPKEAVLHPLPDWQGKPSLTEGGLRVPLVVTGPGIEPGVSDALTGLVDLYPTVAEWIGADPADLPSGQPELDGISLVPWLEDPGAPSGREYLYADRFPRYDAPDTSPTFSYAVRGERYKYVTDQTGTELLFDLEGDTYDLRDQVFHDEADPEVLERLRQAALAIRAGAPFEYGPSE